MNELWLSVRVDACSPPAAGHAAGHGTALVGRQLDGWGVAASVDPEAGWKEDA